MIFRDLGRLRVEVDDLEVPLPGRRLASVLARLVTSVGESVSADALIEAVWGEQPPARALQALETVVWRLRSVLEPGRAAGAAATIVRKQDAGYRLAVSADSVESRRFTDLADRARAALDEGDSDSALELSGEGLALWHGEPYESVAEAEWLVPVRQRLVERRLELSVWHVQALLDTGQPERALIALSPLLEAHPFDERLWGQRMLGLYRTGRQADAVAAYGDALHVLSEELGIDPGPGLRSLQRRILNQDVSLELHTRRPESVEVDFPVRLPSRRGGLVGREQAVTDVVERFSSHRLVTVTGPGGTGKTRLAVEAAHRLRRGYPDGVWFVDLAEVRAEDGDAVRLRDIVAATLELAPQAAVSVERLLTDQVRHRRLLLVVDNCEHVLDAAAAVIEGLLDSCPAVSVLATSREALEVEGEAILPLAPLAGDDAATLFAERLSSLRPDLDPLGRHREEVAIICESVGGLPLGIELAAARARVFELDEVSASLSDGVADLARSGRGPRRQASLLDTVDWSYRLARPAEQVLHRRLAVLPGPVTVEAARALCTTPPLEPDQAPTLLAGLVHRSLLTSMRPAGRSRVTTFRQLVPTRSHAEQLLEPVERAAVNATVNDWVVGTVHAAALDGSAGQAEASEWVRRNATAINSTLTSLLVDRVDPAAVEVLTRLTLYWFERGQLLEAARWYRAAVTAAESGMLRGVHACIARVLGLCARGLGQDRPAATRIADELPLLVTAPDDVAALAAEVLVLVGVCTWVTQVPEVGRPATAAALAIGTRVDRPDLVVRAQALSVVHRVASPERSDALADAKHLLDAAQGNEFAVFVASYACSMAAFEDGDVEMALRWMRRTVEAHRALAMHPTSELLEDIARLLAGGGGRAEAVRCYAAANAMHAHDGLPWPRLPHSADVVADLRRALPGEDYDRLWRSGERLGRSTDAVTLLDEWFPPDASVGSSGAAAPIA